uniref:Uncharacterized protein n=1 Tax=Ixodes scapularis TaxID=6945 RepID=A0A4D5RE48_IXOSC
MTRKSKGLCSLVPYSLCLVCCVRLLVGALALSRRRKWSWVLAGERLLRPFSRVASRSEVSRLSGLRGDFSASLGLLQPRLLVRFDSKHWLRLLARAQLQPIALRTACRQHPKISFGGEYALLVTLYLIAWHSFFFFFLFMFVSDFLMVLVGQCLGFFLY